MLGFFSRDETPGSATAVLARIAQLQTEGPLTLDGPFALKAWPDAQTAKVRDMTCHFEGRLFEREQLAHVLGVGGLSDAALVARAFERWGAAGFAKLRGRFTTALWDSARRRGVLACDVLVTNQAFVWRGAAEIVFASELSDLLSLLPSRPGPDPNGIVTWVGHDGWPLGSTMFDGVLRLSPGELWELDGSGLRRSVYWRPTYRPPARASRAEHAQGLRDVLQRSVARRMSPRLTGVILSGGLDSSIVAALASQSVPAGASLRTYSAVFPGAEWDESWKVRQLTDALNIPRAAFTPRPQGALRLAVDYTSRWAMPLPGVGALVDVINVMQAGRDGADVVLDGQAGDETLGFAPYLLADRIRQGRLLAALELTRRWPLGRPTTLQDKRWIIKNLGLRALVPHAALELRKRRQDPLEFAPAWLRPDFKRRFHELSDRWAWKLGPSGPLWWRYLVDHVIYDPHRDTRMDYLRNRAGTAGVRNESPLYDIDVIEYCLQLPPELAFDSRFTRSLAREAMRGLIPDEVRLDGKKAVFSAFCQETITRAEVAGIDSLINAPDAAIGAYMDMDWVRRFWEKERPETGRTSTFWGTLMWFLASTEIWLRSQEDPGFVEALLARGDIPAPVTIPVDLAA